MRELKGLKEFAKERSLAAGTGGGRKAGRAANKHSSRSLREIMFVIYDHPHDAPDGYLVRQWIVTGGIVAPGKLIACDIVTLEEARARIPDGYRNIGRTHTDDPKIVEVWL